MTDMRKCIGSAKFGIEAHEAPPEEFPTQPSQKDGLGRMCRPHWTEYTRALRAAAGLRERDKATVERVTARAVADYARPISNQQRRAMAQAAGKVPNADGTVQSQATARVATKRAARVAAKPAKKPEPIRTRPARGRKTEGEQIVEAEPSERSPFALPDPEPTRDALDAANVEETSDEAPTDGIDWPRINGDSTSAATGQ